MVLEKLEADCVVLRKDVKKYVAFEVHRIPKDGKPLSPREKFDYFYYPILELPVSTTTTVVATLNWHRDDQ